MNDNAKLDEILDSVDELAADQLKTDAKVDGLTDRAVRIETRLSKLLMHLGLRADGTYPQGNEK